MNQTLTGKVVYNKNQVGVYANALTEASERIFGRGFRARGSGNPTPTERYFTNTTIPTMLT